MPFGFKRLAQLDEVIDLTVGDQREFPRFVKQRLPPALQVDDTEPRHSDCHAWIAPELPTAVRPPMM